MPAFKPFNAISRRDFLRRQQRHNHNRAIPDTGEAPTNTQQASFAPNPPESGSEAEANEGQWSSSEPITYTYQWQLDGVDVAGATSKSLLILVGMVGQSLRCVVRATNKYGFNVSITASVAVVVGV